MAPTSMDLERGVGILDWAVVGLYFAAVLGIGWYWSRRQKSRDDFLLGGRRMNPVASGISIIVTLVSLISYLAVVGETVKFGPIFVIATLLSIPIVYLIVAYLLIPFFMKLPITSAYEILEKPLGLGVRLTGSVLFILIRVVWMALIVFLSAKTFAVMMNWGEGAILPIVLALGAADARLHGARRVPGGGGRRRRQVLPPRLRRGPDPGLYQRPDGRVGGLAAPPMGGSLAGRSRVFSFDPGVRLDAHRHHDHDDRLVGLHGGLRPDRHPEICLDPRPPLRPQSVSFQQYRRCHPDDLPGRRRSGRPWPFSRSFPELASAGRSVTGTPISFSHTSSPTSCPTARRGSSWPESCPRSS